MFDDKLKLEIQLIKRQNQTFSMFLKGSESIINGLHGVFENNSIQLKDVKDNAFKFSFWGLEFIVKAEISFNQETGLFNNGEISTYYIKKEDELDYLLSYEFDSSGNIAHRFLIHDFGLHYYADFVKSIIGYSIKNKLKFQLK
ncbi:MAG: hypothetical protein JXB49_31735 [Bacteroidales bacterium]|nr:hypothetical protein [Bacteroidales bacterium]